MMAVPVLTWLSYMDVSWLLARYEITKKKNFDTNSQSCTTAIDFKNRASFSNQKQVSEFPTRSTIKKNLE